MIYIVSGFPRSGTSVMMQALEAGGFETIKNEQRSKRVHGRDDSQYQMNPDDVYESTEKERMDHNWPRQHEGKVIKVVTMWLSNLAVWPGGYRVLFMRRNLEEIRQSYEAAFNRCLTVEQINNAVCTARETLANRRDVIDVHQIWYENLVMGDPVYELTNLNWPIDVDKAANIIDPSRYRFNLRNLVIGA